MDKKNKQPVKKPLVKKPRKKVFIDDGVWTTVKRDQPERQTSSVVTKNLVTKGTKEVIKKPKPPQTRVYSKRIVEHIRWMREVEKRLNKKLDEMEKKKER